MLAAMSFTSAGAAELAVRAVSRGTEHAFAGPRTDVLVVFADDETVVRASGAVATAALEWFGVGLPSMGAAPVNAAPHGCRWCVVASPNGEVELGLISPLATGGAG